jgi:hypothetical protein
MTGPDLRALTDARRNAMRQRITEARKAADTARQTLADTIAQGEPTNGLLAALTEAVERLEAVDGILQRTEEHHFHGHRGEG